MPKYLFYLMELPVILCLFSITDNTTLYAMIIPVVINAYALHKFTKLWSVITNNIIIISLSVYIYRYMFNNLDIIALYTVSVILGTYTLLLVIPYFSGFVKGFDILLVLCLSLGFLVTFTSAVKDYNLLPSFLIFLYLDIGFVISYLGGSCKNAKRKNNKRKIKESQK